MSDERQKSPDPSANPAAGEPEFILKDGSGEEHEYHITPHDPSKVSPILTDLAGLASGPFAKFLDSNIDLIIAGFAGEEEVLDEDVVEVLADMDFENVLDDVQSKLEKIDIMVLGRRVLRNAVRDGLPLEDRDVFDDAYARNFRELYQAAWYAIRWNGFLGFGGMSEDE